MNPIGLIGKISLLKSGCKPVELQRHQVIPETLRLNLMIVEGNTCAKNKLAPDGAGWKCGSGGCWCTSWG